MVKARHFSTPGILDRSQALMRLHACEVVRQGLDIGVFDTSLLEIIVDSSCLLDIYPSLKSEDIHMVQFLL